MTQLIKITEQNGNKAVSARELHQFLESKERFSKWFERMKSYGFENQIDYTPYQKVHPNNNQEVTDYVLSMNAAKEISMLQKSEKGKLARLYFIEMEKKAKEPKQVLIGTPRQEKRKQQAELINLIRHNLHRGDRKLVAESHGFSKVTMDNVMKGSSFNPQIIKALFDKALQNNQKLGGDISEMILNLKDK
jgi:anti-repressor protein